MYKFKDHVIKHNYSTRSKQKCNLCVIPICILQFLVQNSNFERNYAILKLITSIAKWDLK